MPVITSIRRNVKNASRCSIFVDEEFLAACPIDVALSMGLHKGLDLTPEMERELRAEDRKMVFKQKAYRFATYKPRTEKQIVQHLEKLACVPEEIEVLLAWLREFRLIDDVAYAENFLAASKERKPLSKSAAKATLQRKGVPAHIVDDLLNRDYDEEVALNAARRVAEKKHRMLGLGCDEATKQKLVRFLQYRGYAWDVIRIVVTDLTATTGEVQSSSQRSTGASLAFVLVMCWTLIWSGSQANAQSITSCSRRILSPAINRYQPTTLPVLSTNGALLYMDRKLHPDNTDGVGDADDVWTSRRLPSGEWSSPFQEPLTTFKRPDALFNFTLDGRHALVVGRYRIRGADSLMCFAIISREADTGMFTSVEPIILPGEGSLGKNYYGHLSEDRSHLMLALNRSDSRGDLDLYVARRCKNGWERAESLGSDVNTTAFEGSPWLARDDRTLYFASSGRDDRRGKSDLYVTRRIGDSWTQWSTPMNLGPCVNTTEDETSLSIVNNSDTVLITSWDAESERPAIFSVVLPGTAQPSPFVALHAIIRDAVTGELLPDGYLSLADSLDRCAADIRATFSDGHSHAVLRQNTRYRIRTHATHYVTHEQVIGVRGLDSLTPLILTIRLFDTRRPLASVYFDRGSSIVSEVQRAILDSLIATYEVRNIGFNVVGYTDEIGTKPFNQTLSAERAHAIAAELIRLGVDQQRVQATGRGIEMLGMRTGLSENPGSRRVDIFPVQR